MTEINRIRIIQNQSARTHLIKIINYEAHNNFDTTISRKVF